MQATGYVYLFRCGDLFKIGFSEDPQRRLAQVGGDEILHVILCADARSTERSLHQRFASLCDHGEYFRLGEEEIAEILGIQSDASIKPPEAPFDRVEFQASPDWVRELDAAAESLGVSRSAYIRMACNRQMQADRRNREGE